MMLEQLAVRPVDSVLEIGAGTGYNAALLATLTGPGGHVTTIDVDDDLVDAPFDKIIATVGAFEVPAAWLDQAAPGGRPVIALRLRGAASRSIEFERGDSGWTSTCSRLAVFMPLRRHQRRPSPRRWPGPGHAGQRITVARHLPSEPART
jgi:protein-L-isoaspartate(D-aspartate) O-methyltransferase